jgi:dsRNA-specific ribonuclease
LITNFYLERNLEQLEHILGYTFKCKTWIIEALTHKSFNETLIDSNIDHPQDYERLEFLGDSILNSQVAYYFFKHTMNDEQKKNPKELHKMKTSIVNNVLLSLALIENNMHDFVIFNEKAFQFKYQFQTYVYFVQEQLKMHGTTAEQKENKINGKLNPNASVFSVSNIKVVD